MLTSLGQKYNSRLAYNPTHPEIGYINFKKYDWTEFYWDSGFYWDAKHAILINAPESRKHEVDICIFVSSDHTGDKKSCRSRSNFMMYLSTALVQWYSKKVETSVFGAEFMSIKQDISSLRGISS